MAIVTKEQLKVNGVAAGSLARNSNPKIREYIRSSAKGFLYFDLNIQAELIEKAYQKVYDVVYHEGTKDGKVLFVGTKKNVEKIIKEQATRPEVAAHYVNGRWLGGTLTNYKTIFNSVAKLNDLEAILVKEDTQVKFSKKELLDITRQVEKLKKNLGGIRDMKGLPDLVFLIDPNKEINAAREARKLGIPIVGLVDTYSNPTLVDYVIPGNDRGINSVQLIVSTIANAVAEAKGFQVEHYESADIIGKAAPVLEEEVPDIESLDGEVEEVEEVIVKVEKPKKAKKLQEVIEVIEKPVKVDKEKAQEPTVVKEKPVKVVKEKTEKPVVEKVVEVPLKQEAKEEDLNSLNLTQLKALAKEKGLKGYSALKKEDLINLINQK
ncbi:MAG: 30S ribosomal protein S2 [Acholeplasmatales bacterium]|nr:30S ribosomal protein S2 [Acholeplasmatales bacterium]